MFVLKLVTHTQMHTSMHSVTKICVQVMGNIYFYCESAIIQIITKGSSPSRTIQKMHRNIQITRKEEC